MRRIALIKLVVGCGIALGTTACTRGGGPITDCFVADSRGASWKGSDITPLGAEDAAMIACGQQSADPTSCVVTTCAPRW